MIANRSLQRSTKLRSIISSSSFLIPKHGAKTTSIILQSCRNDLIHTKAYFKGSIFLSDFATQTFSTIANDGHKEGDDKNKLSRQEDCEQVQEYTYEENYDNDKFDEYDDYDDDDDDDFEMVNVQMTFFSMLQNEATEKEVNDLIHRYITPGTEGDVEMKKEDLIRIKPCIKFLSERVQKSQRRSIQDVELAFQDATNAEKLLQLLMKYADYATGANSNEIAMKSLEASNEVYMTHIDVHNVIEAYRHSVKRIRSILKKYLNRKKNTEYMGKTVHFSRRLACRCIYSTNHALGVLKQMEEMSKEYPYLLPAQASYESTLSLLALTSTEMSFLLRSEGKARGYLDSNNRFGVQDKINRRSSLNDDYPEFVNNPWDDHTLLNSYGLLTAAKEADEVLDNLAEIDKAGAGPVKVTAEAVEYALRAWIKIMIRPRRFMGFVSNDNEVQNEKHREELNVPRRAEELLWKLIEMVNLEDDNKKTKLHSYMFRGVISSWSYSNHVDGNEHAERVLNKMGEMWDNGVIPINPTSDLFNAVIGSWARRAHVNPLVITDRCVALAKHMEKNSENEVETGRYWLTIKPLTYQTAFSAFKSALHAKDLEDYEEILQIAKNADQFLQYLNWRAKDGRDEATPTYSMYSIVSQWYSKAITAIHMGLENERSVLSDAGLEFIGSTDDEIDGVLENAFSRLNAIVEDVETGVAVSENTYQATGMDIYSHVLRAWAGAPLNSQADEEVSKILKKVISLHNEGNPFANPTSEMFEIAIKVLVRSRKQAKIEEARELMKKLEALHLDGVPNCKPSIDLYRLLIASLEDNKDILEGMSKIYDSNIVDDLQEKYGGNTLSFHELLELWKDSPEDAAIWAESTLFKVVEEGPTSESAELLKAKNFNAVVKLWIEADKIERAENLVQFMEESDLHSTQADALSYHLLMGGWTRSDPSTAYEKSINALEKIESPSGVSYTLVLEALINSNKDDGIKEAEKMYKGLNSNKDENGIWPNSAMGNKILEGWKKSVYPDKSVKARNLLEWMMEEYKKGNQYAKPNMTSYYTVMVTCIHRTRGLTGVEKRRNFEILWKTFNELHAPQVFVYQIMFSGIHRLLKGKEQQYFLRRVFKECCSDGFVKESFFETFIKLATEESKLKVFNDCYYSKYEDIPKTWKIKCSTHLE